MKNILITCIAMVLFGVSAHAQTGWKWGKSSNHVSSSNGFDFQAGTLDKYGNTYSAGYGWGDTAWFGSILVTNPSTYYPLEIIKNDSNGNFKWVKTIRHADCNAGGMVTDGNGDLYLVGFFDSATATIDTITIHNSGAYYYPFIAKISAAGTVLWAKGIASGASGYMGFTTFKSIGVDAANNIYVSTDFPPGTINVGGITLHNSGAGNDMMIVKYNPAGNVIWAKSFSGNSTEQMNCNKVTPGGNIYLSGLSASSSLAFGANILSVPSSTYFMTFLAKLDSSGAPKWAKQINFLLGVHNMETDLAENVYLLAGCDTNVIIGTDTLAYAGNSDVLLAKFDSAGHYVWGHTFGGPGSPTGSGHDVPWGLNIDCMGNIWFTGTMGFDGTQSQMFFNGHSVTQPGSFDPLFIANYDTAGNYIQAFSLSGGGDDASSILVDNKGNFYLAGDYVPGSSPMVFGTDMLGSGLGLELFFLAKYNYANGLCPNSTEGVSPPLAQESGVNIYPNPASNTLNIVVGGTTGNASKFVIYNMAGSEVAVGQLSNGATNVSLEGMPPGMYLCKVYLDTGYVAINKILVFK